MQSLKYVLLKLKLKLGLLLSRLRHRIIGKHVSALVCETENGLIAIPPTDFTVGRKLAFQGRYDMPQLQQLLEHVTPQSRLLVVGTHLGALLIPLAKAAASVDAVEANPDMYPFLEKNMLLNGLSNITLHRCAAGEGEGRLRFMKSKHNSGGSKMLPAGDIRYEFAYDQPDIVEVPVAALDSLLPDAHFDVMLMDIEGAEYMALKGAQQLLPRVRLLQLEVLPNHIDHVAGVSVEAFLANLSPHFDRARIANNGYDGQHWPREKFSELLAWIYQHHYWDGVDVIFSRG